MKIADYPKNKDIQVQRTAISELIAIKDWGAVKMARDELYDMIVEKEQWLKEQCK